MSRALLASLIVCVYGCGASVLPADAAIRDSASMDAPVDAPVDVPSDALDVAREDRVADTGAVLDTSVSCAAGMVLCAGRCVDPQSSVDHCGACNMPCRSAANAIASCVAGVCTSRCSIGFGDCDRDPSNGCEASLSTAANCGACGRMCSGESPACDAATGSCLRICAAPQSRCGAVCVDLQVDVANCGACANACPVRPNAASSCAAGVCRSTCLAEFGDCDGDPTNGCEALLSTAAHCGACGRTCASGQRCCDGLCASVCL